MSKSINEIPNPARVDFEINDELAGSVLLADAHWFAQELPGLSFDGEVLSMNPVCGPDAPAVLDQMANLLRGAGRLGKWRNEKLRVTSPSGTVLGFVERAAARALGIKTFAVHLMVYCKKHGEDFVWVQQRALDKATDPGRWDTIVGGLVAGDESFELSLAREALEEAGMDLSGKALTRGKNTTVRRNLHRATDSEIIAVEGFMVEDLLVWDLDVDTRFVPKNLDGEVETFALWSVPKLLSAIAAEQLTLEASLVMHESLARRGHFYPRG